MNGQLQYRRGTKEDKAAFVALALIAYGKFAEVLGSENWAEMRANISKDERAEELVIKAHMFVCTDNGKIVGMAHLMPSGNPTPIFKSEWCYLRWVGVHPDYEGRGIAKTLTKLCIDHAINANEQTIALHTSEFMDAARHIYESLGFTIQNELPPIYGKKYWLYTMKLGSGG